MAGGYKSVALGTMTFSLRVLVSVDRGPDMVHTTRNGRTAAAVYNWASGHIPQEIKVSPLRPLGTHPSVPIGAGLYQRGGHG